jgi:hypothetical protein
MAGDEELTIVLADASVVVNLAIVDRVELLASLRDHRFLVPLEVIGEVERQRGVLDAALPAIGLEVIPFRRRICNILSGSLHCKDQGSVVVSVANSPSQRPQWPFALQELPAGRNPRSVDLVAMPSVAFALQAPQVPASPDH